MTRKDINEIWLLTKMLGGAFIAAVIASIYIGVVILAEKITGKNYLLKGKTK